MVPYSSGVTGFFGFDHRGAALFDLAFFEINVFAGNGVVFLDHHLFRHGARILPGDVEKSGPRRAVESDFHCA